MQKVDNSFKDTVRKTSGCKRVTIIEKQSLQLLISEDTDAQNIKSAANIPEGAELLQPTGFIFIHNYQVE
jgi:hypothetical protein